jgi:hypothetical protein
VTDKKPDLKCSICSQPVAYAGDTTSGFPIYVHQTNEAFEKCLELRREIERMSE